MRFFGGFFVGLRFIFDFGFWNPKECGHRSRELFKGGFAFERLSLHLLSILPLSIRIWKLKYVHCVIAPYTFWVH